MVPFHHAYPLIVVMSFLILAGNTCFVRQSLLGASTLTDLSSDAQQPIL